MRSIALALVCAMGLAAGVRAGGPAIRSLDATAFPRVVTGFSIAGATAARAPTAGDLTVRENGVKVAQFELSTDNDLLWISLVLDCSGSMAPAMEDMKEAARRFVDEAPSGFRMELIRFSDKPAPSAGFTPDRSEVRRWIEKLQPEGATALFDAIQDGLFNLDKIKDGRKVLVVFTDGRDQNAAGTAQQSRTPVKEAVLHARRAGVPLYLIGLGDGINRPLMERMAALTHGRFFHAPARGDLVRLFREVAELVSASFALAYTSPNPKADGTERTLEVTSSWSPSPGAATGKYRAPSTPVVQLAYALPAPADPKEKPVLDKLSHDMNASSSTAIANSVSTLTTVENTVQVANRVTIKANAEAAHAAVLAAWAHEDAQLAREEARLSRETARAVREAMHARREAFRAVWRARWIGVTRALDLTAVAALEAADAGVKAAAAGAAAADAGVAAAQDAANAAARAAAAGAQAGVQSGLDALDNAENVLDSVDATREAAARAQAAGERAREAAARARDGADAARDGAEAAREGAEAAREGAEAAREGAEAAQEGTEAARQQIDAARDTLKGLGGLDR
jgi:VWFA-related protein